jgi:hypothetical protein
MRKGDRVLTPRGPGVVAYVRMAPPDYANVGAVSVRLDGGTGDGTVFDVSDVRLRPDLVVHFGRGMTNCGREVEDVEASTTDRYRVTCGECIEAQAHLDAKVWGRR